MSKVLVKLSCLHTCDDGFERRDKLILVGYDDRCLSLLELDRFRPVANSQPNSSEYVLPPPRTHSLLQLNKFFALPRRCGPTLRP